MSLLRIEHTSLAYRMDAGFYVAAVVAGAAFVTARPPAGPWWWAAVLIGAGVLSWSLAEYAIHRFVLHGLPPFRRWHEAHHDRPMALICAPTVVSASLIVMLVFLPVFALAGLRPAAAFTLGVLAAYLAYTIAHHASHHWRARGGWLQRRKRWHALHHHHRAGASSHFGVTTGVWDRVFGTAAARVSHRRSRASGTAAGPDVT
jgi:cyclopropane-fatty-acyl-phospholipid synthase